MSTTHRFPAGVYRIGKEPDPRFTLANERTYLAWIRTGLALIAAGVALEALGLDLQPQLRMIASVLLVLAGIATPIHAWFGWQRTERALRRDTPLPAARLALPLGVALAVVGVVLLLALLLA
jgi:putative membrane protein